MTSIAVVCEALADFQTVRALAERVILDVHHRRQSSPWIDEETIRHSVQWRGFDLGTEFIRWRVDLNTLVRQLELAPRYQGVSDLRPYSRAALKAVQVLANAAPAVDGAILVVDGDDEPDRLAGLEQARRYQSSRGMTPPPLALGCPVVKRECWHLCGFVPDEDERQVVEEVRGQLGHEPWLRTHELTARHDGDLRSAKRVLSPVCGGDHDRELRCLHAPLDLLRQRGEHNGLAAFLAELETHIVPLVLGPTR